MPDTDPLRRDGPVATAPDSLVAFDGRRVLAERGTLAVEHLVAPAREDTVALDVVWLRLPATTATPGSPIVFLMGGPGIPATVMGRIPPYFTLFDRLRGIADVILLDQRGTGQSRPALDCAPGDPPPPDFLATHERLAAALVAALAPCVATWRERGVPAELFGVEDVARDVEAIRRHLGVESISLIGFSYGTRLALEYAKSFPDRTNRVVLQGVLGHDHGARIPSDLEAILDRVDAASPDDIRAVLSARLDALGRAPLRVPVADPAGDTVLITVGREGFQALVWQGIADPRLPALLSTLEAGDLRVLSNTVGSIYRDLIAGGGTMYGRAVYCSAPPAVDRLANARRSAVSTLVGEVFDNIPVSPEFCAAIGISPGSPQTRAANSSGPGPASAFGGTALLVAGTLDDRTPLTNAADVGDQFGDAAVVTVLNGGHELLPSQDVQDIIVAFLEGNPVTSRTLTWPTPRFLTVEEAIQPPRRPGRE